MEPFTAVRIVRSKKVRKECGIEAERASWSFTIILWMNCLALSKSSELWGALVQWQEKFGSYNTKKTTAHAQAFLFPLSKLGGQAEALNDIQAPTLLIVGGNDEIVIQLNRSAYTRLTGIKDLVIVPHATHLFEEPGTLAEVANLAIQWFKRYLVGTWECTDRTRFQSRQEARVAIFEYLECFYDQIRLHSTLEYVSPVTFERAHDGLRS
jgi:hypothetical protein